MWLFLSTEKSWPLKYQGIQEKVQQAKKQPVWYHQFENPEKTNEFGIIS